MPTSAKKKREVYQTFNLFLNLKGVVTWENGNLFLKRDYLVSVKFELDRMQQSRFIDVFKSWITCIM